MSTGEIRRDLALFASQQQQQQQQQVSTKDTVTERHSFDTGERSNTTTIATDEPCCMVLSLFTLRFSIIIMTILTTDNSEQSMQLKLKFQNAK